MMQIRSHSKALLLAGAMALAAGCGAPATKGEKTTPVNTDTAATGGADASVEASIAITGERYLPDALGRPGMPLVEGKKKLDVAKQRAAIEKTKDPEDREVLSQVLATTLYQAAKAEKEPAKQAAGIDDARTVIKQAVEKNGGKAVDEVTLQMLGTFALIKSDFAASETAWSDLVKLKPTAKDVTASKTWWAHSLLLQNKNREAVAAMADVAPNASEPEAAFITSWAKFRTGDHAGAFQAMTAALKGWKEPSSKGAVAGDYMLFSVFANAPLNDTMTAVVAALGKETEAPALVNLSRLLHAGGRYADAIAAVDKVVATGKVTKAEIPNLRVQQMITALTADMPKESAQFGKAALDAVAACAADCAKNKDATRMQVRNTAQRFHSNYVTSQDERYYQPARDMYAAVSAAGDTSGELASQAKSIDMVQKNIASGKAPGKGVHDKGVIIDTIQLHQFEVKSCFEAVLAGSPSIGGGVALMLEFDMKGAVTGASSNPAAGVADMPLVAACVVEASRSWKLPARGTPGVTRVTAKFELSTKK
jgi:hypothetical protein